MNSTNSDPYNLHRFIDAQSATYHDAIAEIRDGRKRSHWSWYVLPQIRGLGSSRMSVYCAISGLPEAEAYLRHPVLGRRLRETVQAFLDLEDLSAVQILGDIDAQKLRSCLTLFCHAATDDAIYRAALGRYFGGEEDAYTVEILHRQLEAA